jgi:hypothetical protein
LLCRRGPILSVLEEPFLMIINVYGMYKHLPV